MALPTLYHKNKGFELLSECPYKKGYGQSLLGWWGCSVHTLFLPVCNFICCHGGWAHLPTHVSYPLRGGFEDSAIVLQLYGVCLNGIVGTGTLLFLSARACME